MRDFYPQWHDMQISIREVTDENAETDVSTTIDTENPELVQSSSNSSSSEDSTPIVTFPSDDHPVANVPNKNSYEIVFKALEQAESVYSYWSSHREHMKFPIPNFPSVANECAREYRKHFRDTFRPNCYRALTGVRSRTITKCPMTHIESKYKICGTSPLKYHLPLSVQEAFYENRRSQRWVPISRRSPCRRRDPRRRSMQGFSYNIELSTVNEADNECDTEHRLLENFSALSTNPSLYKDIQVPRNALAIQGAPRPTNYSDFEEELCLRLNQLPVVEHDPDIIRSLRKSLQSFHFSNKAQKE
ncbi:unnamed protein product [Auanema sp. JU1783]|nr:unnamed protein product [Auanema sp. JU1783]